MTCHELGCYSSVAPGPGEDNANYLYLYLWSVSGKLLVNDSGKQHADSLFSSALCSLVTYWCPLSIEITALCYVREQHVHSESHSKQQSYFQFLSSRLKRKRANKHCHVMSM